jgi:anti-anti-sigma regulatory factor
MVFSLFKKKDKDSGQKMPEREIVRPKPAFVPAAAAAPPSVAPLPGAEAPPDAGAPAAPLPDLEFTPAGKASAPKTAEETLSEFERDFTESNVMAIDVDHGMDSLQSDIEQVAVLYANGQDAVVRPLIEQFLPAYPGAEGLRLWHMLFDFLMLSGDRAGFDKLGVEFLQACEMSPPTWRQIEAKSAAQAAAKATLASCALQGVLAGDNPSQLGPLAEALKARSALHVDCGGLIGCDEEIAGRLGELLMISRRQGVAIVLDQPEAFIRRLRERLAGEGPDSPRSWILLLELLQRHATQADFEECAIDFAVKFERSPPSWEAVPTPPLPVLAKSAKPADNAHYLSGDLKNERFDDLAGYLALHDQVVLDFSAVRRLDFFSAGQLVNRLTPVKNAGREVIIRSPNHLVAELMAVVGLNKVARILVPKS